MRLNKLEQAVVRQYWYI